MTKEVKQKHRGVTSSQLHNKSGAWKHPIGLSFCKICIEEHMQKLHTVSPYFLRCFQLCPHSHITQSQNSEGYKQDGSKLFVCHSCWGGS